MSNINSVNAGVQNQSTHATAQNTGNEKTKKILKGVAIGVGAITLFMGARYLQQCVVYNRNLKNGSIIQITNTSELSNIIDFIENKGYNIISLANLIKE